MVAGAFELTEGTVPSTPSSGDWKLYFKSDGLYFVADTGTEYRIVASSAITAQIFMPAVAATSPTTNGAAEGTIETTTNAVIIPTKDFDASTDEYIQWAVIMPDTWDASTVTAVFHWSAASGSGDVIFGLQAVAFQNDSALDAAFGTAQTVTDTLLTAEDLHITSATSAITIAGSPSAGDLVVFRAYRDANAGGDTLAVDAQLIGITLTFGLALA